MERQKNERVNNSKAWFLVLFYTIFLKFEVNVKAIN